MQEDHHQPFLNVNEQMTMACNLKLKPGITMHHLTVFIYSITSKCNCLAINLQIFCLFFFSKYFMVCCCTIQDIVAALIYVFFFILV